MKNLKIALSITALFITSFSIQAIEVQEQNVHINQQALYQLGFQSIYQPELQYSSELISILNECTTFPKCQSGIQSNVNLTTQSLEVQSISTAQ